MRLADLNPAFVRSGGDGVTDSRTGEPVPLRLGVGLAFNCPHGLACPRRNGEWIPRHYVDFANPLDGGPSVQTDGRHQWLREGETFDTLTLAPSILATPPHGCGWHGWIRSGDVIEA